MVGFAGKHGAAAAHAPSAADAHLILQPRRAILSLSSPSPIASTRSETDGIRVGRASRRFWGNTITSHSLRARGGSVSCHSIVDESAVLPRHARRLFRPTPSPPSSHRSGSATIWGMRTAESLLAAVAIARRHLSTQWPSERATSTMRQGPSRTSTPVVCTRHAPPHAPDAIVRKIAAVARDTKSARRKPSGPGIFFQCISRPSSSLTAHTARRVASATCAMPASSLPCDQANLRHGRGLKTDFTAECLRQMRKLLVCFQHTISFQLMRLQHASRYLPLLTHSRLPPA